MADTEKESFLEYLKWNIEVIPFNVIQNYNILIFI